MTPDQITAIARHLFPLLPHPDRPDEPWWTPGQMCKGCFFTPHESKEAVRNAMWIGARAYHQDHEIPPPDPMDWTVFGQLLMTTKGLVGEDHGQWFAEILDFQQCRADDPRIALFLAVAKMKGVAE